MSMPPEPAEPAPGVLRRVMRGLAHALPARADGTNPAAVWIFRQVDAVGEALGGRKLRHAGWPVTGGAYAVGDPQGSVAVCTLTSNGLFPDLARLPGVAIAGRVYVPNLGIEKIIANTTSNPQIRYLLLCGKESPVFHPGDALRRLAADGVDAQRRIIGATGHLPVLTNTPIERIEAFRAQVELVDLTGQTDTSVIEARLQQLVAAAPGPVAAVAGEVDLPESGFVQLRPGGRREPLAYDPKGYFVITVDTGARQLVAQHYLVDNSPAHEMRGHSAEAVLLGLLREGLVSQLSHAGYLGAELEKAETALRLGLAYEQDQPLRPNPMLLPPERHGA